MRKVIDGRLYDTETATEVGAWDNGQYDNRFRLIEETLYRKRGGEYFVHGSGGAQTQYAKTAGQNAWTGGERIMPMGYDDARRWAEEHMDADGYEAEFGEVSEDGDGSTVVISVRVSPSAKAALDRMAARTGRGKGELVTEAIMDMERRS